MSKIKIKYKSYLKSNLLNTNILIHTIKMDNTFNISLNTYKYSHGLHIVGQGSRTNPMDKVYQLSLSWFKKVYLIQFIIFNKNRQIKTKIKI